MSVKNAFFCYFGFSFAQDFLNAYFVVSTEEIDGL